MKKSKRIISMILAVIMLSMTAIGVNAHDELPAEKIDTTEIAVESVETEATGDSELLEEVEPSVSEIEMQSNESETEVEATEEEELQPQRASRTTAYCVEAVGFSGTIYSYISQSRWVTLSKDGNSITKDVTSSQSNDSSTSANSFLDALYTMQSISHNLSENQQDLWRNNLVINALASIISFIATKPSDEISPLTDIMLPSIQAALEDIEVTLGDGEAKDAVSTFSRWKQAENQAEEAYGDFLLS